MRRDKEKRKDKMREGNKTMVLLPLLRKGNREKDD